MRDLFSALLCGLIVASPAALTMMPAEDSPVAIIQPVDDKPAIEYKLPWKDMNEGPEVCIPNAGDLVRLYCHTLYETDWPAHRVFVSNVTQTWAVDERPSPTPPPEGNFDIQSLSVELFDDGRGFILEFEMPEEPTSISVIMEFNQYQCQMQRMRKNAKHTYTVTLLNRDPWDKKVEQFQMPLAPVDWPTKMYGL